MIVVSTIAAAILKGLVLQGGQDQHTSDHVITGLVWRVPNGILDALVPGFSGNVTACHAD